MVTRGIREFVARDWSLTRQSKDDYWAQRIDRLGATEGFRIADELRRQALAQGAAWPSPEDRRRDLLAHAHLAELMKRARPACGA